ncbi:centromere kinetochore component CENP-T-domain-containing protein, partial [Lophiotrema nucula]
SNVAPRPITPYRRASSAGPTPGSQRTPTIAIRTPGGASRTPRGGQGARPTSARRAAPTTPHAIRALRERANAARTPGRNRRRSGRVQRETPRDTLRDLSRILARNTRAVEPSPLVQEPDPRIPALDDFEDDADPVAPRLSLALGDMYDDDSFHETLPPPRRSLLPDLPDDADTGTINSLEFGRRALSEDPRMMFGGRVSDRFAEFNELGIAEEEEEEYEIDGTFIRRRDTIGPDQLLQDVTNGDLDNTTTEIRALTGRRDGRRSDVFADDDEPGEPTFQFMIPQRLQATTAPLDAGLDENADEDNLIPATIEDDIEKSFADIDHQIVVDDENDLDETAADAQITGWESDDAGVDDDPTLKSYREEPSAIDRSLRTHSPGHTGTAQARARRQRRELKLSRFGHEYPSFNAATVKNLASSFARSQGTKGKIGKDTLDALVQTTDWFFEQIGEDLAAYSQHAGRKMIDEDDVIALMKRYVTVYLLLYRFVHIVCRETVLIRFQTTPSHDE